MSRTLLPPPPSKAPSRLLSNAFPPNAPPPPVPLKVRSKTIVTLTDGNHAKTQMAASKAPPKKPLQSSFINTEDEKLRVQHDVAFHSHALSEAIKANDWGGASAALQALTLIDIRNVLQPLVVLQTFQAILSHAQLTLPSPMKLKLFELFSAYSLAYYAEKTTLPEEQKKVWQDNLNKALTFSAIACDRKEDVSYAHGITYYLDCAKAVIDLAPDTHQIDWCTNAANVLSIAASQFGLCSSQAATVATDLFYFAKDYLNQYITQSWFKTVCMLRVHQLKIIEIMHQDAQLNVNAVLHPPTDLLSRSREAKKTPDEELSLAILQIQRVLTVEYSKQQDYQIKSAVLKALCGASFESILTASSNWHIIYACIEILEHIILKTQTIDIIKLILNGRLDPFCGIALNGLSVLYDYDLNTSGNRWYIRARIAELAHKIVAQHTNPECIHVAHAILVKQKHSETKESKLRPMLDASPESWDVYFKKLQTHCPAFKSTTDISIAQLTEEVEEMHHETHAIKTLTKSSHGLLAEIKEEKQAAQEKRTQKIENLFLQLRHTYQAPNKSQLYLFSQRATSIATVFISLIIEEKKSRKHESHYSEKKQEAEGADSAGKTSYYEDLYEAKSFSASHVAAASASDPVSQRLLVVGRTGVGKSTLCQFSAYQWACGKLWTQFRAVFWISLRNLNKANYPLDGYTWIDIINKECFNNALSDKEERDFLENDIQQHPDAFHFLLDGYDELPQEAINGYLKNAFDVLCDQKYCLITSRPQHIFNLQVDRQLEIMGFTSDGIETYVQRFFAMSSTEAASAESAPTAKILLAFLRSQPSLWRIAHIPLMLSIICKLAEENRLMRDQEKQITISTLYKRIVNQLFERHLMRSEGVEGRRRSVTPLLPDRFHFIQKLLEKLAYENIINNRIIFSEAILCRVISCSDAEVMAQHLQALLECGLLRPVSGSAKEYEFIHLTFQEYFAAGFFASVIKEGKSTADAYELMQKTIIMHRYNPRLQEMWWFVAGHLASDTTALQCFFSILRTKPRDLMGIYERRLLLHCLIESEECETLTDDELPLTRDQLLQPFLDALRGKNAEFKRVAALALSDLGSLAATPAICTVLLSLISKNQNWHVSNAAMQALGKLGALPATPGICNSLLRALQHENSNVKKAAANALENLGVLVATQVACDGLLCALQDPDWSVKKAAMMALCNLGSLAAISPAVHQELLRTMKNTDPQIRRAAIHALGKLSVPSNTKEICDVLTQVRENDLNESVKTAATIALINLGALSPTGSLREELAEHAINDEELLNIAGKITIISEEKLSEDTIVSREAADALSVISSFSKLFSLSHKSNTNIEITSRFRAKAFAKHFVMRGYALFYNRNTKNLCCWEHGNLQQHSISEEECTLLLQNIKRAWQNKMHLPPAALPISRTLDLTDLIKECEAYCINARNTIKKTAVSQLQSLLKERMAGIISSDDVLEYINFQLQKINNPVFSATIKSRVKVLFDTGYNRMTYDLEQTQAEVEMSEAQAFSDRACDMDLESLQDRQAEIALSPFLMILKKLIESFEKMSIGQSSDDFSWHWRLLCHMHAGILKQHIGPYAALSQRHKEALLWHSAVGSERYVTTLHLHMRKPDAENSGRQWAESVAQKGVEPASDKCALSFGARLHEQSTEFTQARQMITESLKLCDARMIKFTRRTSKGMVFELPWTATQRAQLHAFLHKVGNLATEFERDNFLHQLSNVLLQRDHKVTENVTPLFEWVCAKYQGMDKNNNAPELRSARNEAASETPSVTPTTTPIPVLSSSTTALYCVTQRSIPSDSAMTINTDELEWRDIIRGLLILGANPLYWMEMNFVDTFDTTEKKAVIYYIIAEEILFVISHYQNRARFLNEVAYILREKLTTLFHATLQFGWKLGDCVVTDKNKMWSMIGCRVLPNGDGLRLERAALLATVLMFIDVLLNEHFLIDENIHNKKSDRLCHIEKRMLRLEAVYLTRMAARGKAHAIFYNVGTSAWLTLKHAIDAVMAELLKLGHIRAGEVKVDALMSSEQQEKFVQVCQAREQAEARIEKECFAREQAEKKAESRLKSALKRALVHKKEMLVALENEIAAHLAISGGEDELRNILAKDNHSIYYKKLMDVVNAVYIELADKTVSVAEIKNKLFYLIIKNKEHPEIALLIHRESIQHPATQAELSPIMQQQTEDHDKPTSQLSAPPVISGAVTSVSFFSAVAASPAAPTPTFADHIAPPIV